MKKKICIWGGGWSGLTAALELSESNECEVHIYEASNRLGGKILGSVNETKISTHAIRLISEYYPAFADVCGRIPTEENKTLLDRWSPIEFFNFYASSKNKSHLINRRLDKSFIGNLELLKAVLFTFELRISDIYLIYKAIKKFRSLDEEEIEKLEQEKCTVEGYLKSYNLSEKAKDFLFTYLGITVAARPGSTSTMGLDLMSKMFVGAYRSKHLTKNTHKNYKSWVIDGPLGDRLLPPFLKELEKRGVHFHTHTTLSSFDNSIKEQSVAIVNETEIIEADAHILALNNKVIEQLGFGRKQLPLKNEWSIGGIVPLQSIPKPLQQLNYKTVTAVMDSAWAIVFVVWLKNNEGGLWSDAVDFPEGTTCFLEVVTSRLDSKGIDGKTFFECNPTEAANEILKQIGVEESEANELASKFVFSDCLSYKENSNKDEFSLYGPTNSDGCSWELYAPIYTSSPETLPLNIKTDSPNIFLCGEAVASSYPYIKTPTLELTSETAKEAVQMTFDYLNIDKKINQEYPERFLKRQQM